MDRSARIIGNVYTTTMCKSRRKHTQTREHGNTQDTRTWYAKSGCKDYMQVAALLGGAIAMTFLPETRGKLLHNLSFPLVSDLSCSSLSFSQLMFIGGMEVGKPIQLQWSCFSPTHRRRSQSRILDWLIWIYLQITNIYVYKCRLTKCSFTSESKTMAADA